MPVSKGGRGWRQVGYSDLIMLDGTIVNLVPYNEDDTVDRWEITNGAKGINGVSRHAVYAGGLAKDGKTPKDTRTPEQLKAMESYTKQTIAMHPCILVAGHYHFANKACPSFDVKKWGLSINVSLSNLYQ